LPLPSAMGEVGGPEGPYPGPGEGRRSISVVPFFGRGTRARGHLAAPDEFGWSHQAGYRTPAHDLAVLAASGISTVDLGGGAGLEDRSEDGMGVLRAGLGNSVAVAWPVGEGRDDSSAGLARGPSGYFPACRAARSR
jgi:hypothetical protein